MSHRARRDWDRKEYREPRFTLLSSLLPILERRDDRHHVVRYDPDNEDRSGAPTHRTVRRSSRGRVSAPSRGRRVVREGEEDLEEVQYTSRRRAMRGATLQEGGDKIQIEVGSVKALSTHYGIVRGMTWMVILASLMWWIPILGPATVGYVGGRKSGGPARAGIAALVPLLFAFGAIAVVSSTTEVVPLVIKHFITGGYTAVLGSLPFDFPIIAYIFSNLAAVMNSGPEQLFIVLAFALAGGGVTQMKIQERMVPTITARVPRSRVANYQGSQAAPESEGFDTLVSRVAAALGRDGPQPAAPSARAPPLASPRPGVLAGLFSLGRHRAPVTYGELSARGRTGRAAPREEPGLDPTARHVVASVLAQTSPQARGRVAKDAVRAARIEDLDVPDTIAFVGASGHSATGDLPDAHRYRPSKLYHIYGGSVNPVARKKLEKRLRRTHTLHAMRRATRSVREDATARRQERARVVEIEDYLESEPERPRSLESKALPVEMHYDALEHLENAQRVPVHEHAQRPAHAAPHEVDELGGLIAHLGEGGEAVVEARAVHSVEYNDEPMFDRKGRQRARIAEPPAARELEEDPAERLPKVPRALARAIEDEDAHKAPAPKPAPAPEKPKSAAASKAKVDKWLEHTLGTQKAHPAKAVHVAEPAQPKKVEAAPVEVEHAAAAPPKPEGKPRHAPSFLAPKFEIDHGATEADAEAESPESEDEAPAGAKRHRSASEILREIKQEKKDEAARKAQAEEARKAAVAKAQADEIERRVREAAAEEPEAVAPQEDAIPMVALAHAESHKPRPRGEELEPVAPDTEVLSRDIELTLDPVRETSSPTPAQAHAAVAGIEMLDVASAERYEPLPEGPKAPAPEAVVENLSKDGIPELEGREDVEVRTVKPSDVVLAGPSTDIVHNDPGEGELNDHDREKIKRRLEEGWNRL